MSPVDFCRLHGHSLWPTASDENHLETSQGSMPSPILLAMTSVTAFLICSCRSRGTAPDLAASVSSIRQYADFFEGVSFPILPGLVHSGVLRPNCICAYTPISPAPQMPDTRHRSWPSLDC